LLLGDYARFEIKKNNKVETELTGRLQVADARLQFFQLVLLVVTGAQLLQAKHQIQENRSPPGRPTTDTAGGVEGPAPN
jgi:glucan phosphorylase